MDPLDDPKLKRLTFEDLTWLALYLVLAVCTVVIFVLGLWTAARHLWGLA